MVQALIAIIRFLLARLVQERQIAHVAASGGARCGECETMRRADLEVLNRSKAYTDQHGANVPSIN